MRRTHLRISKEYEDYIREEEMLQEKINRERYRKSKNYTTEVDFNINKDITVN